MTDTVEASSSRFVEVGGVRLHFHDLGSAEQTLIFLHGGGPGSSGWSDFGPVAVALADRFRCLVVDLPQYGLSDKPFVEGSAPAFHAKVVLAFMRAIGTPAASFVCQSIGGSVALLLAIEHPPIVERLVLNGTQPVRHGVLAPLPMDGRLGATIWDDYYGSDAQTPAKMRRLLETYEWFDGSLIPDETVERRYRASIDPRVVEIAADLRRRGEQEDLLPRLDRVRSETLLVWGQHDRFGGIDVALAVANRMPDAQLHVLPRCAHHPQEEVPERYLPLVRGFLVGGRSGSRGCSAE